MRIGESKLGTRIIGKCMGCGSVHDGLLEISVQGSMLELGISKDDCFHTLETISIEEVVKEAAGLGGTNATSQ